MNKQEGSSKIRYSSKVVIVDKDGNVYLEKCPSLQGNLGLFGGRKEGKETPKETAIRELGEENELGIKVSRKDLKVVEVNGPIEFKTGTFIATVFVLYISDEVAAVLSKRKNVVSMGVDGFREQDVLGFVFDKKQFLDMVERALDYKY